MAGLRHAFGLVLPLLLVASLALPADAQSRRQKREAAARQKAEAAAPAPSVRTAVQLWQQEKWADAVAMWRPFAESGDADAMYNMGQAHMLGRGLPRDEEKARGWFRRAAEKGHRPAQTNLGVLLWQLQEKEEALKWLKQAADAGEPRAQYVYGVAQWNGDGVPRSLTLAYAYLARAADQGLDEAKSALSRLTPMLKPVERANGWALATAMARGDGRVEPLASVGNPGPAAPAPVPQTPSVNPAAMASAADGAFRIQIGAYSRRDLADADMSVLRQKNPALINGLTPHYAQGRGLVRLQLGSFASRDLARDACRRFKTEGRACLVVEAG